MINQTNYKPANHYNTYTLYSQYEPRNPVVQFNGHPSPAKLNTIAGTTILRNGSNSYKPIPKSQ
jgi:hypothetical protein